MKKIVGYIVFCLSLLLVCGCTNDEWTDGLATVDFRPTLDADVQTRSMGDGSSVSQLIVVVCNDGNKELMRDTCEWKNGGASVKLKLAKQQTYHILFWAQHEGVYAIGEDGILKADYTDYQGGDFEKMEELDAFCTVEKTTIGENDENKEIRLKRPLAQLNILKQKALESTLETKVSLSGIAVAYNPFTGKAVETKTEEQTFSFASYPQETLTIDETDYHYLASVYLFPTTGVIGGKMQIDQKDYDLGNIPLYRNQRTNLFLTE